MVSRRTVLRAGLAALGSTVLPRMVRASSEIPASGEVDPHAFAKRLVWTDAFWRERASVELRINKEGVTLPEVLEGYEQRFALLGAPTGIWYDPYDPEEDFRILFASFHTLGGIFLMDRRGAYYPWWGWFTASLPDDVKPGRRIPYDFPVRLTHVPFTQPSLEYQLFSLNKDMPETLENWREFGGVFTALAHIPRPFWAGAPPVQATPLSWRGIDALLVTLPLNIPFYEARVEEGLFTLDLLVGKPLFPALLGVYVDGRLDRVALFHSKINPSYNFSWMRPFTFHAYLGSERMFTTPRGRQPEDFTVTQARIQLRVSGAKRVSVYYDPHYRGYGIPTFPSEERDLTFPQQNPRERIPLEDALNDPFILPRAYPVEGARAIGNIFPRYASFPAGREYAKRFSYPRRVFIRDLSDVERDWYAPREELPPGYPTRDPDAYRLREVYAAFPLAVRFKA